MPAGLGEWGVGQGSRAEAGKVDSGECTRICISEKSGLLSKRDGAGNYPLLSASCDPDTVLRALFIISFILQASTLR